GPPDQFGTAEEDHFCKSPRWNDRIIRPFTNARCGNCEVREGSHIKNQVRSAGFETLSFSLRTRCSSTVSSSRVARLRGHACLCAVVRSPNKPVGVMYSSYRCHSHFYDAAGHAPVGY